MKRKTWIALLLLPALLLAVCAPAAAAEDEESVLDVIKVEDLPEDFILGMDLSSLPAEEASGVRYYDFDGREKDLLEIMAENGITHIRVRVWNDPYDGQGRGFGGGNCDIDTALAIGRRATRCGLKLIADFHYSDFWADPGKYKSPRAWEGLDAEAKARALYAYTRESLETLRDSDVDVGMVQIGNEINNGLAGETDWEARLPMLAAGSRAVREIYPEALVAVHFTEPHNRGLYAYYADLLQDYGLDYDVFGSSYYPFWHGTLENLSAVLSDISRKTGKQVMVLETSWPYTGEDTDFFGNSIQEDSPGSRDYPFSVQGQADAVRDVIDTVAHIPGGIGVCCWEGAWISVGGASWEENSAKWERYGSGWASSFAAVYDPDDAGKWYGGSSWDNQAFFDSTGHPLDSLRLFSLLRCGSGDQSPRNRASAPAEQPEETLANLLENGSFESGELSPWILVDRGSGGELFVEDKAVDSLEGSWHMHFWNPNRNSVDFDLEQTVEDLPEGSYVYSISIMGGDCGESEIFAYVKVDGELRFRSPMSITVWNSWDTAELPGIELARGQTITVGISVKCAGAGAGAWGKIDCASLRPGD